MKKRSLAFRRGVDKLVAAASLAAAALGVFLLFWILSVVVDRGFQCFIATKIVVAFQDGASVELNPQDVATLTERTVVNLPNGKTYPAAKWLHAVAPPGVWLRPGDQVAVLNERHGVVKTDHYETERGNGVELSIDKKVLGVNHGPAPKAVAARAPLILAIAPDGAELGFGKASKRFNWEFFTEPTKPYGIANGGIANAIAGTFLITLCAALLAVPLGLLGGVFLSEFSGNGRLGNLIRFSANVMMGIPSIIVGLFVYTLLVYTTKRYSGFAGAVALAIIMFPVVTRITEDMLSMVPNALRESALALGAQRWKATFQIIFRAAKTGLVTGILLSIARVSGETAPLLFTALWSNAWPVSFDGFWPWQWTVGFFNQPTSNLTVAITEYATNSPFDEMHVRAWGAALLITLAVLLLNIVARSLFREARR